MAVSKRTRFEILRRDNHTCQYCGAKAPDVTLHVDHIVPVALGGSDKPDNLVAACKDCNSGKTSIAPDAPLVDAISQRSAEWAVANATRNAHIEADFREMEQYREEFFADWNGYTYRKGIKDLPIPLDTEWAGSLNAWWKTNVPRVLIQNAVTVAMTKKTVQHEDRFRYFCGVVWRTLDEYDQRYPEQTNAGPVFGPDALEEYGMDEWRRGHESGLSRAAVKAASIDFIRHHIDHTEMERTPTGWLTGEVLRLAS